MRLVIVHGGQTGVDRGAALVAQGMDLVVEGYMPKDLSDEAGPIPAWARRGLRPLKVEGYMQRTTANVVHCDLALVVVRDRHLPYATPGSALTLQAARSIGRPRFTADPDTPIAMVEAWLREKAPHSSPVKLMVAGPRASRWEEGEFIARSILSDLVRKVWSRNDP